MKIKKNDEIIVTLGKDKGKKGKVEKVFAKEDRILVPGINEFKKHKKARYQGEKSGIVVIIKPIALSKVALICPNCKKMTRVGYKIEKKSTDKEFEKIRICKKCKKEI